MVRTCVDAFIKSLSSSEFLQWLSSYYERRRRHDFEVDLRFIKMFLWCCVSWDSDEDLRSIITSIESIWEDDGLSEDLDKVGNKLLPNEQEQEVFKKLRDKIHISKKDIEKHCERLISNSLTRKSLTSHEIQQFLHSIIINIESGWSQVVRMADEINVLPMKNQIETLKEKLLIFWNLVEFTNMRSVDCKEIEDFNVHVLSWANKAACLTLLYWLEVENERELHWFPNIQMSRVVNRVGDEDFRYGLLTCGLVSKNKSKKKRMATLVSDLLHKVNPRTPEFIDMCFAVIKSTKSSSSDIFLYEEFVSDFVSFLLHNMIITSKDGFRILCEGLIYLITSLVGPVENSAESSELISIRSEIDAVLVEASHLICKKSVLNKVAFRRQNFRRTKLMKMIDKVKKKLDKHYVQLPHSSWSKFPLINGLGFVESFLVYLNDLEEAMSSHPKLVPSLKHYIFTIKEELASLRLFLQNISERVNEYKELKDLWEEIICVAYHAELAIKRSFFIDHPFCLSYILWNIQAIQSKVTRMKDRQIYTTGAVSSLRSSTLSMVYAPASGVDEEVVGFEQELERLIDQLTRGTKELDIVSIVGMGGIGKTTLAKKLYNGASVTYYFHQRAFCTVSQVYKSKNILLDILSHLIGLDGNKPNMLEEDLADLLRKSLKGRKYLIVLDDMWDINAWNAVKDSFPNDHNGSRVMFTTRIYDVALNAKPHSGLHRLRFLTIDESWDLLQRKIFHKNACPAFLCEVGRSIAENCKGLPLAVVLIAGLLAKSDRSLSFWQDVADNLASYASDEGCRDILELSYKHLPEALKSCFLYLGAFPEGFSYMSGNITKLWAAEGFALTSDRRCVDKVAKDYLNYLGDRSLLIVTQRSLAGKIKWFRLHDVIREFCISKAQEEHLLCLVNGHDDNFLMPSTYDGYRMCVQAGYTSPFLDANPRGSNVHSLLCFHNGATLDREICSISSSFRYYRLIQVLNLRPVEFLEFPTEITMLVHLRYLALTFGRMSSLVPPTIANLRDLETLLLASAGYSDVDLPETIWVMKRLRHLKIPHFWFNIALGNIGSEGFSQLPDLEILDNVQIRDKEEGEELLRRLRNVRKLTFRCRELPEQLVNLSKLESLHIGCSIDDNIVVQKFSFPSTLRKLSLGGFNLPGRELSTMIGSNSLPRLQVLKLDSCQFDSNRWDVEVDEFPGVKCLTLLDLRIKYWNATTDSFPCLEKLILRGCRELVQIPPCFGELSTLRALEVWDCSEVVKNSALQIQEEQLGLGNDSLQFKIRSIWKVE